jgi:hypothetical protein
MGDTVSLATISDDDGDGIRNVTIGAYKRLVADKNKSAIAEMVYHRFYGRYIKPFSFENDQYKKHYKNGFSMMASACLLIEAFESFRQGWEETQSCGDQVFDSFFARESAFKQLKGKRFYKHVRCGILHQAEVTGGFTIVRKGPLFDPKHKRINAQKFHSALNRLLLAYKDELSKSEWDSEVWDNYRRKMRYIIKHST